MYVSKGPKYAFKDKCLGSFCKGRYFHQLTFSCIMLKNGQTYFKCPAASTPQDF